MEAPTSETLRTKVKTLALQVHIVVEDVSDDSLASVALDSHTSRGSPLLGFNEEVSFLQHTHTHTHTHTTCHIRPLHTHPFVVLVEL